jgi:hypothetical protein
MTNNNNPWPFTSETNIKMTKPHLFVIEAKKSLMSVIEQERQTLLADAKRNGVSIVHIFCTENTKGGLTIAFRKTRPNEQSTNMVDVAIATCSFSDTFSRKIGTQIALQKWFDGDMIQLPLSSGHADEDLNGRVKWAFTSMWNSLR